MTGPSLTDERLLCYIAGPFTNPDPAENTHRAIQCATKLLDDGLVVPYVPHLTLFWHAITPRPYETWLAMDLVVLRRCDALLRLAGHSPGADREVAVARLRCTPIFEDVDELHAWAIAR